MGGVFAFLVLASTFHIYEKKKEKKTSLSSLHSLYSLCFACLQCYILCVLHDCNYLLHVLCVYYFLPCDWGVFSMLGVFDVLVDYTLMHVLVLCLYIH